MEDWIEFITKFPEYRTQRKSPVNALKEKRNMVECASEEAQLKYPRIFAIRIPI